MNHENPPQTQVPTQRPQSDTERRRHPVIIKAADAILVGQVAFNQLKTDGPVYPYPDEPIPVQDSLDLGVAVPEASVVTLDFVVDQEEKNYNWGEYFAGKYADYLSITDSLTGLSNGRGFERQARNLDWSTHRYFAFMFDYDKFKSINDMQGHAAGDYIIKLGAQFLQERQFRKDEKLIALGARRSGDEFVGVLQLPYEENAQQANEPPEKLDGEAVLGIKERFMNEWNEFIAKQLETLRGEQLDTLTMALANGFGLSVGIAELLPGSDTKNIQAAVHDADMQINEEKINKIYETMVTQHISERKALAIIKKFEDASNDERSARRRYEAAIRIRSSLILKRMVESAAPAARAENLIQRQTDNPTRVNTGVERSRYDAAVLYLRMLEQQKDTAA